MNEAKSTERSSERSGVVGLVGVLIFFFVVILMCAGAVATLVSSGSMVENGIGVVEVKGEIESAEDVIKTVQQFEEDPQIKAMVVRIDSPGGSVSASQEMVEAIQSITKPVVISMGNMAASGGYYVACAGPKIYANAGTLTGSIGVISQVMEVEDLLTFFKVKVHTVKTGALKDAGSPYRAFNEADRAFFSALGVEILDQFVSHVAQARQKTHDEIAVLADGRVWSGREAQQLGLIDEIGGFQVAINDLKKMAHITGNHTLVYPKKSTDSMLEDLLMQGASHVAVGLRSGLETAVNRPAAFEYRYIAQ